MHTKQGYDMGPFGNKWNESHGHLHTYTHEGKLSRHVGVEGHPRPDLSVGECSDTPAVSNLRRDGRALLLIARQAPVLTRGYITNRETQQGGNVGKTLPIPPSGLLPV